MLGKSSKCTSRGSSMPLRDTMIRLGCSSTGSDRTSAATCQVATDRQQQILLHGCTRLPWQCVMQKGLACQHQIHVNQPKVPDNTGLEEQGTGTASKACEPHILSDNGHQHKHAGPICMPASKQVTMPQVFTSMLHCCAHTAHPHYNTACIQQRGTCFTTDKVTPDSLPSESSPPQQSSTWPAGPGASALPTRWCG